MSFSERYAAILAAVIRKPIFWMWLAAMFFLGNRPFSGRVLTTIMIVLSIPFLLMLREWVTRRWGN